MGTANFRGPPPKKTITEIKIKSGINDYFRKGNPQAKFGNTEITARLLPI